MKHNVQKGREFHYLILMGQSIMLHHPAELVSSHMKEFKKIANSYIAVEINLKALY